MKRFTFGAWCAASLTALIPSLCSAQTRTPAQNNSRGETAMSSSEAGQRLPVNERFVHNLADNCQYVGNVRGSVQRAQSGNWRPDLAIDASVTCPNSSAEHLTVHTLVGERMNVTDLLKALTERASVVAIKGEQICTYSPSVSFTNGRLTSQTVSQSCQRLGMGGGPGWYW